MAKTAQRDPLQLEPKKKRKIKQEEEQEESGIKIEFEQIKSEDLKNINKQFKVEHDDSITESDDDTTEAEEIKVEEVQERTKEELAEGSEEITVDVEIIELSDDDDEYVVKPKKGRPRQSPKEAQCDICSKVFGDKHILKKHLLIHTDEKPHICETCGKTFRHKHSLKSHKFTHEGPDAGRFFTCMECGASFKRNCTLRTHTQIHTGERPHSCHLCDKTFVQKVNLQQHIKTHLNERNHACDQCEKKFMTASKLKRHYQRHTKKQLKDILKFDNQGVLKMPRVRKKTPRKIEKSLDEFQESHDDDDVSDSENAGWVSVVRENEESILS